MVIDNAKHAINGPATASVAGPCVLLNADLKKSPCASPNRGE